MSQKSQEPDGNLPVAGNNARASWPFSLHNIRANIAYAKSEDAKTALVSAFLWCIDAKHPVTMDEFARRVGYSKNVIYKLLSGKYLHPTTKEPMEIPDQLVEAIEQFLALEKERYLGGKNEFVTTPTAKRVWLACDLARESQTPVFVTSISHIGKSWALLQYAQDHNHGRTVYCRMKAASGLGGMVRALAKACGISPKTNTAKLTDELKRAITPDMLIILDEMHLLQYTYRIASFFACVEVIRELYDETGCGMVLCGTELLDDKLQQGKDREMQQIIRRGVHRFKLPDMPTRQDLTLIFRHNGLEFPDRDFSITVQKVTDKPYDVIRALAKYKGLKAITERLRYARKLATRRSQKISWELFIEAHITIENEATPEGSW